MLIRTEGADMPLEPLPVNRAPELVFGLVAPIGVDLEFVSEVLNVTLREMHYNAQVLRVTKIMRAVQVDIPQPSDNDLSPEQSYISTYKERISYANAVRGVLGDFALSALAISAIRSFRREEWKRRALERPDQFFASRLHDEEEPLPNQAYIIRQFKRPEEVTLLRQVYSRQFILISAYASQEWRIRRLEAQERQSRGGLVSEIEARNRASALVMQDARESQDTHGQNVRDAFPLGDVFIDATSRVNCESELRRFIHLLFGSNEITPTHDEYGMYLAKSVSLRSADLSRQVGAAIFRSSGEVAALGCNEVPKSGGGTYWMGDEGDARDFVQGTDPNEMRKNQVLVDLIDRLHKGGHLSPSLMSMMDPNEISKQLLEQQGPDSVGDSKVMDLLEFGRIVHAEMSALSDAARKGVSVENATLYCTTFPCHICAKLIVAAGIAKVIYLEPYPKSYASELHGDAISVDSDAPGAKVAFNAFLGISPYRYRDLFEKRKRKDAAGVSQRWNEGEARPLINSLYPSYFRAEAYVVSTLGAAIEKRSLQHAQPQDVVLQGEGRRKRATGRSRAKPQ
jgi:deoxycytidylate deaminase